MSFEFVQQRRVEFAETDMAGIVHFANFFRWMESAEHAFLRSLGVSVHETNGAQPTGWPRVKVGCEYQKPLRFEEMVEVALSVMEVLTRSVCYGFEFRRGALREVVATGEVVAVHAALQPALGRMEAAPIPQKLREMLVERLQA